MLVFIDESGYPRPTDNNKFSVLLAVCIYEKDIKSLTNKIYKLKDEIYSKQDEIKSTNIIRKQTIEKNRTNNKKYADELVNIAVKHNITTFCIIMKRPDSEINSSDGILPKQYQLLLKKIEYFSEKRNIEKSIFVFDETNEAEDLKIANSFNQFLFRSKLGKKFDRILETPFFVSSKITPAIQIADIFAGITRQYYENNLDTKTPETEFEDWLNKLFVKIHNKTENFLQPNELYYEFGFQKVENLNYIKRIKNT